MSRNPHDPRTWGWPQGMPQSLADTVEREPSSLRDGSPAQNDPVHSIVDAARFALDRKLTEKHNGEYGLKETRRVEWESGMIRDTTEGKTNWLLVFDGPLLRRWAELLTRGAATKGRRNWMNAGSNPETMERDLERFREGLVRHMAQFLAGETDEDHAAAIAFNLNGCLHVMEKISGTGVAPKDLEADV